LKPQSKPPASTITITPLPKLNKRKQQQATPPRLPADDIFIVLSSDEELPTTLGKQRYGIGLATEIAIGKTRDIVLDETIDDLIFQVKIEKS
jgi:hypothetical protein